MLIEDLYFKNIVECAVSGKITYEGQLKLICEYIQKESPCDYHWYFNGNGFLQVDVPFEDVGDYIVFIESLVDCKYTSERNLNGVTFLVSLSTLHDCLEDYHSQRLE